MVGNSLQRTGSAGFGRTDMIFTVGTVVVVGALLIAGIWLGGEQRRIFVCARHMKILGQAFEQYAHDHDDALPPAVLDENGVGTSWDSVIAPYLMPGLKKADSPEAQKSLEAKVAYLFKCPSDLEPRGGAPARSYSMPMYDISKDGWPPGPNSLGGLGLYLDTRVIQKVREADPAGSPNPLPAIRMTMVPDPANTALLVERISILNALWATKYACIVSARQQFDAKTFEQKDFHGGKMNYLMLDGHVELLWPIQSGGQVGSGDQGLWTLRADD